MATMSELAEVRAELARLEKQEQQLVEQLHYARTSIRQQRKKIDELVRRLPSPIDRVPNEILLRILELCLQYTHNYCSQRKMLACVSHRWMDIMMNSSSLWTTIRITPTWSASAVKAHVTNSCQSSLEIEIYSWDFGGDDEKRLPAMLDVLLSCAHRWMSLVIHGVRASCLHMILKGMAQKMFPSLRHVSIKDVFPRGISEPISQFCSGNYPQLKHLELEEGLNASSNFQFPPSLTSLSLHLCTKEPSSIFQQLALQKLTILTLNGFVKSLPLGPNSIYFPLLEEFVCRISEGEVLMRAIVAPKLISFSYSPPPNCNNLRVETDMFNTSTHKFPNVTSLVLVDVTFVDCTEAFPIAFPAVRNLVLDSQGTISLFRPRNDLPNTVYLPHLKTLTVHGLNIDSAYSLGGRVACWLERRRNMGLPKLLVKFLFASDALYGPWVMLVIHGMLHEYCFLEWENVSLGDRVVFSGTIDESLWLVRTFYPVSIEIDVSSHRTRCGQRYQDTMANRA